MRKFEFTEDELVQLINSVSSLQKAFDYQLAGQHLLAEETVTDQNVKDILDELAEAKPDILERLTLDEMLEFNKDLAENNH